MDEQFGLDFLMEVFQNTEYVTFSVRGVGEKTYTTHQFKRAIDQIKKIVDLTDDAFRGCNCAVSAYDLAGVLDYSQKPTMTNQKENDHE